MKEGFLKSISKMKNKEKFPFRKAFVSSVIILMVSLLLLTLLYTIVNNVTDQKYIWIIFPVWGGMLVLGLAAYWIYQLKKYHDKKQEKRIGTDKKES